MACSDNGIDLDPAIAERGFAGTLSARGIATALIGKAHFRHLAHLRADRYARMPGEQRELRPDWYGPYMGFRHVELMLEGHNQHPPMEPPRGQHYERWYHQDGRGAELTRLYQTQLPPITDAHETFNSALPVAFHNSTWIGDRAIAYLREHASEPFCVWAFVP
jgi:arylsulfatase A-like enzyme